MFISGGGFSGVYIVMAKTAPNKVSTFIVPAESKGIMYGKKEEKMGWTIQPTALVTFDNVRVHEKNRIGEEGVGFKIALKALDGGRINIGSCSLGGAAFCLEAARKYMGSRKQFGQKLSDFQYLQFKFADMATDVVCSRYIFHYKDLSCVKLQNSLTQKTPTAHSTHRWPRKSPLSCARMCATTLFRFMEGMVICGNTGLKNM